MGAPSLIYSRPLRTDHLTSGQATGGPRPRCMAATRGVEGRPEYDEDEKMMDIRHIVLGVG